MKMAESSFLTEFSTASPFPLTPAPSLKTSAVTSGAVTGMLNSASPIKTDMAPPNHKIQVSDRFVSSQMMMVKLPRHRLVIRANSQV